MSGTSQSSAMVREETEPLKTSAVPVWLAVIIVVLALIAAGVGLFWRSGSDPISVTTIRGETVELYGQGLYRRDTLFVGAANRGTDAVTLFLGIPLLVVTALLYRRGSLRGGLLLMGALTWFLYVYASYALGAVAYNDLFLIYVALFSASLYALVVMFRSIDTQPLAESVSPRLPRRGLAVFLFVSGALTAIIWLIEPVSALLTDEPPAGLDTYSTLFTTALDIGVIVPATVIAGLLVLRRDPLGYLIAVPLLVLEAMLAPMIGAQTVSQVSAGVSFTAGEIVGPIAGFTVLALVAIWFLVAVLRAISNSTRPQAAEQ